MPAAPTAMTQAEGFVAALATVPASELNLVDVAGKAPASGTFVGSVQLPDSVPRDMTAADLMATGRSTPSSSARGRTSSP